MPTARRPELPELRIRANQIYSPIREKWVQLTPEERVRQEYLRTLVNEYGYRLDQIAEEVSVAGRGAGNARADFLVWRTVEAKRNHEHALIVVECKADNVTISMAEYGQGANYAQYEHAQFFVTHNNRETKYWRVDAARRMPNYDEIENIPHASATADEIDELLSRLKVFREDEFADLLHQCHNVIRNREKKDPAAAFDEIAKILFIKVGIERRMKAGRQRQNLFTATFLDQQAQIHDDPISVLFEQTKREYKADKIFAPDERVSLKSATVREIVRLLERYNLSDTSEDVKGIAFERFLGRTFRGEIGQFFTPRTIVEFMVRMLQPAEGDIVCDPASGSGGFLIRFFEIVRQQILADIDRQYQAYKGRLSTRKLEASERAALLTAKYDELQATVDPTNPKSRLWQLANRSIYGCDANDRMARTSKMNMIMHGDGHGGVHHHDGFINVNGIFEGRFDLVLTNPPFGANVEETDVVLEADVTVTDDVEQRYQREYGSKYTEAMARVRAARGQPIAGLFDLPRSGRVKTEILFLERCLALLKPGGRLGIVLPEGVFNNPSLAYVREYVEDRAWLRAIVSLPQETFYSAGASVKASLLFLQKFTREEAQRFSEAKARTLAAAQKSLASELKSRAETLQAEFQDLSNESRRRPDIVKALRMLGREMEDRAAQEARAALRREWDYEVFLYDAEKVGITATGGEDENELYPNARMPTGTRSTALEAYLRFRQDPASFAS
jgi:type I restriction enzyme M protein